MNRLACICICAAFGPLTILPCPVLAQSPDGFAYGISPALLRNADDHLRLGVRAHAGWKWHRHTPAPQFSRSRFVEMSARLIGVGDARSAPQNQEISAQGGISISLRKLNPPDDTGPIDQVQPPFAFDYGIVGLGVRTHCEASADLDERSVVGSLVLRYLHNGWWWMPSAVLAGERVNPLQSRIRDGAQLEEDPHNRLSLRGYWYVELARLVDRCRGLAIEVEGSAFRTSDLGESSAAADLDDGRYYEVGFVYSRQTALFGSLVVRSASIRYASGQLPTAGADRHAWTVGLVIGRDQ